LAVSESKLDEYVRVYRQGKVIFEEGEVGNSVFLIKEGRVEVLKGSGADQRSLTTLEAGEVFGELALEKGEHKRSATVRALTEVTGWQFPGPAFESLIEKEETFRQKLVQSLVDRLIDTTERLADRENEQLQQQNRLLVEASQVLLSNFGAEELDEDDDVRTPEIDLSSHFLSYRYDSDIEDVETFRNLNDKTDLQALDDEQRLRVTNLARSIVEDLLSRYSPEFQSSIQANVELAEAARSAKKILAKLEDHTRTYEKQELQKMMERRNELQDILSEKREAGRDDYLLGRLEKQLEAIKQELNLRYD
jgi:CRP-like cAMP-binding protein